MSKHSNLSKMQTITRKDIIQTVAVRKRVSIETARTIINMFLSEITEELAKGNRIQFRRFGCFDPVVRKERKRFNPKTRELMGVIPKHKSVKFKPRGKLANLNETDTDQGV